MNDKVYFKLYHSFFYVFKKILSDTILQYFEVITPLLAYSRINKNHSIFVTIQK